MKIYSHYIVLFTFMIKNIEVLSSVKHVMRCTRRFTAGYCEEQVIPVWTFVFQKQDCVLRMGCPPSSRVNRFRKHSHCMHRCKVLVDLYTQIILNETAVRTDAEGSPRRDLNGKSYLRMDINDSKDSVYEDEVRDVPSYEAVDNDSFGDSVPSNIDGDTQVHTFLDMLNDNKLLANI